MTTPTEGYALPEVPTTPGEFRIDVHAKAAEDKLSTPPTPRRRRLSLSKQPKSA